MDVIIENVSFKFPENKNNPYFIANIKLKASFKRDGLTYVNELIFRVLVENKNQTLEQAQKDALRDSHNLINYLQRHFFHGYPEEGSQGSP